MTFLFVTNEKFVIGEIVAPTIPQYPPTIINIEPKSRAAFPLSVRMNARGFE